VLQTGEFDFAWNVLVEDEVLKRMENAGKGRVMMASGGSVEFIQVNTTDPYTEVDGERASPKSRHPLFKDPRLRQAMSLLVDRQNIQDFVFGRTGTATPNILNNPARFRSPNRKPSSTSTRPTRCWTVPAGSAAATACARRTGAS
jgi:peptide/nickel transport system substrate-binding protein